MTSVGEYVKEARGINNIVLVDSFGNEVGNTYESDGFTNYMERTIKSESVKEMGNCGMVATLVI